MKHTQNILIIDKINEVIVSTTTIYDEDNNVLSYHTLVMGGSYDRGTFETTIRDEAIDVHAGMVEQVREKVKLDEDTPIRYF